MTAELFTAAISGGTEVAGTPAIASPGALYAVAFRPTTPKDLKELLPPAAADRRSGIRSRHSIINRPDRSTYPNEKSVQTSGATAIIRLPETELVAVLGYNKENDGADVSKLIGGPPTGVKVTTSMDTMVEAKPEVVIHTARFFGDFRADADIIRLL